MKTSITTLISSSITRRFPTTFCLLLAAIACGTSQAAQLLTGDSNNAVHQQDATILDISADGDYILFSSGPPASGSTPGIVDGGLYVRRISANSLTFVGDTSVPDGPDGSISDNGRYITWRGSDSFIYWRDSVSDVTRLITPAADGASRRPVISADGRYVAYASVARNIVSNSGKLQPSGKAGVYLYDSNTQTTTVVSLGQSSVALNNGIGSAGAVANAGNEFDFSADGKYIVFTSDATNVHSGRPNNYPANFLCVYRRNLATGAIDILNKTSGGSVSDGNFSTPRTSANGSRTTFFGGFVGTFNGVRLISSVNNGFGTELYVKDSGTGDVWWASKTTDNSIESSVSYLGNAISGNGQAVAFGSSGTKLVTMNTDPVEGNDGVFDIFRVDLSSGGKNAKTSLVTTSPNGSGNVDFRFGPFLPGNANYTAFCTSQVEAMLGTGSNDTSFFQGFSVAKPAIPTAPEIGIQAGTTNLTDNGPKVNFGAIKVGKTAAKTFTIKNSGNATLKNLALTASGAQKGDFTVTALTKTSLSSGGSITFKVTFKPKAKSARNATLKVASNDANENPFDIKVTGTGN